MRKRYLDGTGWKWLNEFTSRYQHIDGRLSGYLSFVRIETVREKRIVQLADKNVCLADNGYKWFSFMPDHKNWSMTHIMNQNGAAVEWYFDVTKSNAVDETGKPYIDDLYLDVVLLPNSKITVLDEDELKSAFAQGKITKSELDLAYKTRDEIIETVIPNRHILRLNEQYSGVAAI